MATAPSTGRAVPATAEAAADSTRDLYERFHRPILAYCHLQLRNREEAEDAMQTTFLNAFRALERGVVPDSESAWLYKIAQHVCLTRRRSWSRRRVVESPQDLAAVSEGIGTTAADGGDAAALTDALRALPEPQRRAILLREWRGLSYREIATEMQVSQASVETMIFRARRSLAQSLSKLRGIGDVGSLTAALKSLLVGGGTKAVATLLTVATTSVVAATPAARHRVAGIVDAVAQTDAPARPAQTHAIRRPIPVHVSALPLPIVQTPPKPVTRLVAPHPKAHRRAAARPHPSHAGPAEHVSPAGVVRMAAPAAPSHPVLPAKRTQPREPAPPAPAAVPSVSVAPPAPADDGSSSSPPTAATTVVSTTTVAKAAAPGGDTGQPKTTAAAPPAPVQPAIVAFSPAAGTPGTVVQLTGKGLGGATGVRFNGTSADFKVSFDGQLTAKVPLGATSGPITVLTPAGAATSDAPFAVNAPSDPAPSGSSSTPAPATPAIGSVSPAGGAPGTMVTIGGSRLTGATAVRFRDVNADFTVVSDTQITARVPAAATSGTITVVTPQGAAASPGSFTVTTAAPTLDSVSPSSGAPGASVTLTGHNLAGATSVAFNGTSAAFVLVSEGQLTATVPAGATTGPVAVTTPGGTVVSTASFTVTAPPPEISTVSPGSGAPGTAVTIGGHRFSGATAVSFNGVAASFTVGSDSAVTAIVPAGATTGPVSVTTPNGTATSATAFGVTH